MDTVYLATFESRNFTFQAVGVTDKRARSALIVGLQEHSRQYGLDTKLGWADLEDINCEKMEVGAAYRDHSQITESLAKRLRDGARAPTDERELVTPPTPALEKITLAELRKRVTDTGSKFFERKTLAFFGDTMRNYGVRPTPVEVMTSSGANVRCWMLYRKQPVKHGLSSPHYFEVGTYRSVSRAGTVTRANPHLGGEARTG